MGRKTQTRDQIEEDCCGGMIPVAVLEKVEELEKKMRGWFCHERVCVRIRDVVGVTVTAHEIGEYVATFYLSDCRAVRIELSESGDVKRLVVGCCEKYA
ncbi:MAG: hypothetical protein QW680_11000 [Pyrobaculum sp.]